MTTVANPSTLSPDHFSELIVESAINPDVAEARGYRTLYGNAEDRAELNELGFSRSVVERDDTYPALLIPLYRATGETSSHQLKPANPRMMVNGDGKPRPVKYETPKGASCVLDVPSFTQERLADSNTPLWITEGMKKTDALISQGRATIGLTGVFNWRRKHGTLGDWEDIPLKDRQVVICFDSDATENRNVQLAMRRLGAWLESKGASSVFYLIVPKETNGNPVKGADDFFAAGGTLSDLQQVATKTAPADGPKDAFFTDAVLSNTVCEDALDGSFCWAAGLGWLSWNGHVWNEVADVAPTEAVRQWAIEQFQKVLTEQHKDPSRDQRSLIDGWRSVLSKGRIKALVDLSRGILQKDAADFDSDPDLLCVKNGYVDLRTGTLHAPDPDKLMTKSAGVEFDPKATHPLWDKALEAVPEDVRGWYQDRIGQAATGYMTPDDSLVIAHGDGENGKSTIVSAIQSTLGSYAVLVSDRVLMSNPDSHPTELMDLRGARYAVLEETPEARRLDTHRLKKTVGTEYITARRIRQDDVTFQATHSLFVNTNFKPVVSETDHGTWRRLALLTFPYTYRRPGTPLNGPYDRVGDPTLRTARHRPEFKKAVLAWIVQGAGGWYGRGRIMLPPPTRVEDDTLSWRAETDLILGFVNEALRFVKEGGTPARDLLSAFNGWLEGAHHKPWTDKTFSSRFGSHDVVKRHGVIKRRVRLEAGGHPTVAWMGVTLCEGEEGDDKDPFAGPTGTPPEGVHKFTTEGVHGVQSDPVNEKSIPIASVNGSDCTPCTAQVRALPATPAESRFQDPKFDSEQNGHENGGFAGLLTAQPVPAPEADTQSEEETVMKKENRASMQLSLMPDETDSLKESLPVEGSEGLSAPVTLSQPCVEADPQGADAGLSVPRSRPSEAAMGLDLETRGKKWLRWPVEGDIPFISLAGHGSTDSVRVDTSPEALCARLRAGGMWVGHYVYGYDLPALERHTGLRVEETTGRVRDTQLQAMIADPPTSAETKAGPGFKSYSLDALGQRLLGRPKDERGKQLAKKYGGWENIPANDPQYQAYCADDVNLVEEIHDAMPWTPYMEREMRVQAIMTRMTLNGFRIDEELLSERICEGEERKHAAMQQLSDEWGAPMGSKSPFATKKGKEWLAEVYERFGVKRPPLTPKGHLATSAVQLKELADHSKCPHDLRTILGLMSVVTSERTIYKTIRDQVVNGRVHVDIWPRQASGRWSAGFFTTMGKRGERLSEREVFLPEPGEVLLSVDLGQIDARIVAAHAQDPNYLSLFAPGEDLHSKTALELLGSVKYRSDAKAISHLANYGGSENKVIGMGFDAVLVRKFFAERRRQYPQLIRWTDEVREVGSSGQLLDNGFGRPLRVESKSAYTQAPAQVGQGGTRDMMAEGLLDLVKAAPEVLPMLRGIVHDEVVLSVPESDAKEISRVVVSAFEREWAPPGKSLTVSVIAGASRPGKDWADCYGKD